MTEKKAGSDDLIFSVPKNLAVYMIRIPKHIITVIFLAFVIPSEAFSYEAAGSIMRGNELYEEGKPEQALSEYEKVLEGDPDDPTALYNKAVVHYSVGEYSKAEDAFLKAMASGKRNVEERTTYNIGNTKFREAELSGGRGRTIGSYEQALGYYKRAMELDPEDVDAKYNYEITLRRMKEARKQQRQKSGQEPQEDREQRQKSGQKPQEDKEERQKSGQKPQKDKEERQKSGQEPQKDKEQRQKSGQKPQEDREERQKSGQEPQEDKEERQKSGQKPQKDKEERQKSGQEPQEDKEQRQKSGQEPQKDHREKPSGEPERMPPVPGRMSREQAEMLLDSQEEEENRMRAEMRAGRRGQRPPVARDW